MFLMPAPYNDSQLTLGAIFSAGTVSTASDRYLP